MTEKPLHILVIGAHPDDCDITAGGVAVLYRQRGHRVKFVSVTDGRSGHHQKSGEELVAIRKAEAAAAGKVLGVEYEVLDFPDGGLQPTISARETIIRLIRTFQPDLILTHRPCDYHPDHRYTSQLVCDAAYMVTVPPIVPDVPALRDNPVIMYLADSFQRPWPFTPDVAVDIESVFETAVEAMACHESQFFEWLAYNHHYEHRLPADADGRRAFLKRWLQDRIAPYADRYRPLLENLYGPVSADIRYIEAFELCEYGSPLTAENRKRLFPFLP